MKTQVLIALGLVAVAQGKHHRHHHKQAKQVQNQELQAEIDDLRDAYNNLAQDYENLSKYTQKVHQNLVQGPYGNAGGAGKGPTLPSPQPFVRGEKQWIPNAQAIGDWGDQQETVANTRIPYASTAQLEGPYGNAGGNGKGPTLPSPQPFVRGEKQWMTNAQSIGDWGENQMTVANTRIPYASTAQLEGPYGNAGPAGKGPTLPSPQPFVRGEKQWTTNANAINDWGDQQETVANTRIPYASTLQTEADAIPQGPAPFGIATEAGHLGGPALPSPQPFIRGEKQWTTNAQAINDWGDQQETVANTRIPYASTLQLESDAIPQGQAPYGIATEAGHLGGPALPSPQPFIRGEKQWTTNAQAINDWGDQQETVANTRIPYASTLQLESEGPYGNADLGLGKGPTLPSPQPFTRGEKQWMTNAQSIEDWGIHQMEVANARIPYASTLVQTKDSDPEPDMSILYEKEAKVTMPEKVQSLTSVPHDFEFAQTKDDDVSKMEGMLMEDPNIPLNLRLVQTQPADSNPENIETMSMDDLNIPNNFRLLHVQTKDGDELVRII